MTSVSLMKAIRYSYIHSQSTLVDSRNAVQYVTCVFFTDCFVANSLNRYVTNDVS